MNTYTALRAEADKLRAQIDTFEAAEILSTEAGEQLEQAYSRLEEITPDLQRAVARQSALNAAAALTTAVGAAAGARETDADRLRAQLPTSGAYLAAVLAAGVAGAAGGSDAQALELLRAWNDDADLLRAPAQQAIADNAGVIPSPIVSDLVKFVDPERYLINALGVRPMFLGTATRPRVTQTTLVGAQASEFTELSTRKMLIVKDALTRATYGGYVELSAQDAEFSDPGMLQIILQDLAEQYGVITDAAVCTALNAAATNTFEMAGAVAAISTITVPATWAAAFSSAATQTFTQSKKLPTHLMCSPDVWGTLSALVDSTGRPIYPILNPTNANGTFEAGKASWSTSQGPAGLQFLVDPNFAANTCIIGNAGYAEVYEAQRGAAVGPFKPGTLATEIGYYGFLSTYMRAEGFVKLVNAV
jgi:HK97 family phage major capsid protein